MMTKGEPILVEQVNNGFIVSPKQVSAGLTKLDDVHVFSNLIALNRFMCRHFGNGRKPEAKAEEGK